MRIKAKILITLVVAVVLLTPVWCWGAGAPISPGGGTPISPSQSVNLPNPLGDIKDPRELIGIVISAVLGLVGSIALLVFIAGGIIWMTSGGSAEKVQKGKNMIIWAGMGLAVIFFSYAIIRFVLEALTKAPS